MRFTAVMIMLTGLAGPGFAQDSREADTRCMLYGVVAEVMINEIIDNTFREVIAMMQGENPALLGRLTKSMQTVLGNEDFGDLTQEEIALLSEQGGNDGIQLMMAGSGGDAVAIRRQLVANCENIGGAELVMRIKQAKSILAGQ